MGMNEAKIEGKDFKFNGWFRWVVGGLAGAFLAGFMVLTNNVIANDRKYMEKINKNSLGIERMELKLDFIIENQNEFKTILRRTAPYERKD